MTPVQIFRIRYERLGDLVATDHTPSPDQLIDLPIIIRQFLTDNSPLVHQVNRDHHLRLRFTVGLSARERSLEMSTLGLPIPDIHILMMWPPNETKRDVSLDEFLAYEVVKIGDNYYSVHQLIDACANKLGGVHFDPKGIEQETIKDIKTLGQLLETFGGIPVFGVLLLLARVTHQGLAPLYEATGSI